MLSDRVAAGEAQVWVDTEAVLLTQITDVGLVIWLCAGDMTQAIELSRDACWWAERRGMRQAHFTGRKGWGRVPAIIEDGWVAIAPDRFTKELNHAEER